ncbi:MAG TPA: Fic family protein [Stellaceae bacterium]|nr:Fic family protein [Stellaceae bacterium]
MEPLMLGETSRHRGHLMDLALDLALRSAGLRRSLPRGLTAPLADLVRAMNCYYSNLIEGHRTHPVDIERALRDDYSGNAAKRDLQLEARAHILVQRWIDGGGLAGRAVTVDGIREVHRRFCEELPEDFLWIGESAPRTRLVPGGLREHDVEVGRHLAVSPAAVPRFLERFAAAYGGLGRTETILAIAAAHHRLLWIHPFLDGNGRVARLVSHAVLLEALDTGALWSVARGLARNLGTYKGHLAACDRPRRNDLDGRGHLSEECLAEFTRFFLSTCIDQVSFMDSLMQPDRLRARILLWVEEEVRLGRLPPQAGGVLDAVLRQGTLERGQVPEITGTGDRQARRILAVLIDRGVLTSPSSRAAITLAVPASLASRFVPGLFPELPG